MTAATTDIVTLRNGRAGLHVAPAVGGSIARYWIEGDRRTFEWLRPASRQAIAAREAGEMACYPLVPFSNRIRQGRFDFAGRRVELPLNQLPEPHVTHGHGWQNPWSVADAGADHLTIEYDHAADAWPFPYRATQRFKLAPDALFVDMEVVNRGAVRMPVGLGLHPYFIRTPLSRLTAAIERMWRTDDEIMPIDLVEPPSGLRQSEGLALDGSALDNCFTGWRRRAEIVWPEWNAHLTLTADEPLSFLVVYTPPGQDHFCVEPVSHCTDAFNLANAGRNDTGMLVLDPGARLQTRIAFTPGFGGGANDGRSRRNRSPS
ncbi:MAG: aldose 1-epimerase [Proteobacteria bacterium]|nr:aldose 1-epimerase [Pseudomonadota bacterium]